MLSDLQTKKLTRYFQVYDMDDDGRIEASDFERVVENVKILRGEGDQQRQHEYLYWEFYEKGSKQALRFGPWKAIRKPLFTGEIELYHVESDIAEERNVATENPEVIARAEEYFKLGHTPNPLWKVRK